MGQRAQSTSPHRPAAHDCIADAAQAVAHEPQCAMSLRRSTHAPSQQVVSPVHGVAHAAPESNALDGASPAPDASAPIAPVDAAPSIPVVAESAMLSFATCSGEPAHAATAHGSGSAAQPTLLAARIAVV
jgi:hypothetical protein